MTQQQVWVKCRAEIFYTQGDYVVEDDFEVRMNGQTLEVYTMGGPKNLVGFKGASQGQTGITVSKASLAAVRPCILPPKRKRSKAAGKSMACKGCGGFICSALMPMVSANEPCAPG